MQEVTIRKGTKDDLPQVFALINELAVFEKAPHEVTNSVERMEREGFGEKPAFEFFVAEVENEIVGISLYYFSYSTWKGRSLYIDDLIVTERMRHRGIGNRLFQETLNVARQENCGKIHWQVLDWNTPAIDYYRKVGASFDGEWINCAIANEKF